MAEKFTQALDEAAEQTAPPAKAPRLPFADMASVRAFEDFVAFHTDVALALRVTLAA